MSSGFVVCFGITIFGDEPLRDKEVPCFMWVQDLGHFVCYCWKVNNMMKWSVCHCVTNK